MVAGGRNNRIGVIVGAIVLVAMIGIATAVAASSDNDSSNPAAAASTASSSSGNPVTRTPLGQATPVNAPGNTLYLQQVTIQPGAQLPEHFHQGTQVARIVSGTLTYNIVSGTAVVTHTDGTTEQFAGPTTIELTPGESIVEDQELVHFGANAGTEPVVIELAALLADGAPVATSTGTATPGMPLHITAPLDSQSRNLNMVGPNNSLVYGWNNLVGTATVDGQPVKVDLLGAVNYSSGNGPFSGFTTFTFADGSTVGVGMQGQTIAKPDGSQATFNATLGVIGGTGTYANAKGTGSFTGTRDATLGTSIQSTYDLSLAT